MKVQIHGTDLNGKPMAHGGDVFEGQTALDIVEGMKLSPFTMHLSNEDFMRKIFTSIGQAASVLPSDPEPAALYFLRQLESSGYARFIE